MAAITGRMLALLPAVRAFALTGGPVTVDLDTTDVEVYGRKKRGVAYNHQGQRVGRPHVALWAESELVLAAEEGTRVGIRGRLGGNGSWSCAAAGGASWRRAGRPGSPANGTANQSPSRCFTLAHQLPPDSGPR
jgi:hypothetical protein